MNRRARPLLLGAGTLVAVVAIVSRPAAAADAAAHTWQPFVLVTGLLLVGAVANEDGLFELLAGLLGRVRGGDLALYVAAMALTAVVTVFLNLDTSVAFLTPVLLYAARRRGAAEARFLYGCVFMSNAASLLLPGSNLTNLLVLANEHVSGATFLARMAAPWLAAVLVTAVVVGIVFRRTAVRGDETPAAAQRRPLPLVSAVAVATVAVLILTVADAALPVLVIGLLSVALHAFRRRMSWWRMVATVDVVSLGSVFLVALALGTLARVWTYPASVMAGADTIATAAIGALGSVLVNNLPAAVLLGSRLPAHPRSLLIGLDIGPNLAVTGSLSALLWWQAAHAAGARPSALRYTAVGAVLVPLTIAAALAAGRLTTL